MNYICRWVSNKVAIKTPYTTNPFNYCRKESSICGVDKGKHSVTRTTGHDQTSDTGPKVPHSRGNLSFLPPGSGFPQTDFLWQKQGSSSPSSSILLQSNLSIEQHK